MRSGGGQHRRRGSCLLAGAMSACVLAPAAAATLEEAVRTALATHPQVAAADSLRRAAEHEVREARSGYLPSVELSAALGRERTDLDLFAAPPVQARVLPRRETALTLSQTVFDGQLTRSEVARRSALLGAAGSAAADSRETVALAAVQAYLEVLRSRRLEALARENVESHRRMLEKVQIGVEQGVSQLADLQQAQARLALAQSILVAREGRLREAEADYRRVMGEPPGEVLEPAPDLTPLSRNGQVAPDLVDAAIRRATAVALERNPTLGTALAQAEAAGAAVTAARSAYLPRVSLEARTALDRNIDGVRGERDTDALMLVTRWNLFRGGGDQARERASVERLAASRDGAADTRLRVEAAVARSVQAMAASQARLLPLQHYARASLQTLESYRAQRELGRRTLLDVLNAENEYFNARSSLVNAEVDHLLDGYLVLASQGLLAASVGAGGE